MSGPWSKRTAPGAAGGGELAQQGGAQAVAAGEETPVEDAQVEEEAVFGAESGAIGGVAGDAGEEALDVAPPEAVELAGEADELGVGDDAGFARRPGGEELAHPQIDFCSHQGGGKYTIGAVQSGGFPRVGTVTNNSWVAMNILSYNTPADEG